MRLIQRMLLSLGLFMSVALSSFSQIPLKEAFERLGSTSIPFNGSKRNIYWNPYSVENPLHPGKIYKDFQCSLYYESVGDDDVFSPTLVYKFQFGDLYVGYLEYSGNTDYETGYLILVNQEGKILDVLLAYVRFMWVAAKQYCLFGGNIQITSIEPVSQTPILLEDFMADSNYQLEARRVDETYEVSGNKFVKVETTRTERPMFFKSGSDFTTEQLDLWDIDGDVLPLSGEAAE